MAVYDVNPDQVRDFIHDTDRRELETPIVTRWTRFLEIAIPGIKRSKALSIFAVQSRKSQCLRVQDRGVG